MNDVEREEIQMLVDFVSNHVQDYDFDVMTMEELNDIPEEERTEEHYYAHMNLLAQKYENWEV